MIKHTLDLSTITPLNRVQIEHLVALSSQFSSSIIFAHRSCTVNGKSMLGLLSLGATGADPVTLEVDGEDEEAAAREIKALLDSGVAPPKAAPDAMALMHVIKDRFVSLLGENLVGIYLHGALAGGCFQWDRSDVDFLVVVRKPLPLQTKIALVETVYALSGNAPPEGLDMYVMLEKYCHNTPYPVPYDLHYSSQYKRDYERNASGFCERMNGEAPGLLVHFLSLQAFGQVIHGPSISRLFDRVNRKDALSAILLQISDAADHLHEKPVYYVLALCQALAYQRENKWMTKKEAGEWALHHLNIAHQQVIQAALNAYGSGLDMFYDQGEAEELCYDVLAEMNLMTS